MVDPIISPFNTSFYFLKKSDESWQVTVAYQKLNQGIAPERLLAPCDVFPRTDDRCFSFAVDG